MMFRATNIVALLALGLLTWVHFSIAPVHWWWFALLVWLYASIVFIGCVNLSLGFFMPVKYKANTRDKVVALSFDDGPHPIYTTLILDALKKNDVSATFFCIGKNISGNEAILERIKREGHIIGNHSFSHDFWFDLFSSRKMLADMQDMDSAAMKVVGVKPALFRPPYGVMNPNLKRAIVTGGYTPVGWSIRSFDTAAKDKQKLLLRIMGRIKAGDIILLHDSLEITAVLLPELIQQIHNKGFRIAPLDKMLDINAYA